MKIVNDYIIAKLKGIVPFVTPCFFSIRRHQIKTLFSAVFFLIQIVASSQTIELNPPEVFPSAPTTAELGKFGSYPVNLSTGLPNIEIPLYVVQSGDLQIPIKLMYHASGIKVNQTSSWVGLGWSLNTGGLISLETRDTPDELEPNPYTIPDVSSLENLINSNPYNFNLPDINSALKNSWVKDAYHINLPSVNGIFFLDSDSDGEVYTKFPPEEFKIYRHKTISLQNDYLYKVIDKKGVVYFLADTEQSEILRSTQDITNPHIYNKKYNSSWLLNKIINSKGDSITYDYGTQYSFSQKSESHSKSYSITQNESNTTSSIAPWKKSSSTSFTYANKLQQINIPNGRIRFVTGSNPQYEGVDGQSGVYLEKIIIEKGDGISPYEEIKTISFQYSITGASYFESSTGMNRYRFKLDKVVETKGTSNEKEIASFEYDDVQLPSPGSYSVDYFGYFNGKSNQNLIPKRFVNINGSIEQIGKADRSIDVDKIRAGILTKVIHPTKGATKFEYEPNSFYGKNVFIKGQNADNSMDIIGQGNGSVPPPVCQGDCDIQTETYNFSLNESTTLFLTGDLTCDNCDITNAKYTYAKIRVYDDGQEIYSLIMNRNDLQLEEIINLSPGSISIELEVYGSLVEAHVLVSYLEQVGNLADENVDGFGLRIKTITNYDSDDSFLSQKRYQYQIPKTTNSSGHIVNEDKNFDRVSTYRSVNVVSCISPAQYSDTNSYTYSSSSGTGFENNSIQYSFVTELENDINGDSKGRTQSEFSVEPNQIIDYNSGSIWVNQGHKRGKLIERTIYNEQNDSLIKENHFYSENQIKSSSRKDFKMYDHGTANYVIDNCGATFTLSQSKEILETDLGMNWYKKDSTITIQYLYGTNGLKTGEIESAIDYVYSDYNQEIQTITMRNSGFETIVNGFQYAHDLNETQLISENRISVPLSTNESINGQIVNSRRTEYSFFNGLYQPYEVYGRKGFEVDLGIDDDRKVTFDQYTTNGKVKEYHFEDGKTISIVWGYSGQYPIAKIENLTYGQIPTILLNNVIGLSNSDVDQNALLLALEELRNDSALSSAMITTYTYDPLVGVTSITNAKGMTTYYEYDDFGRLEIIKDNDGHILSKNAYHYKSQ